VDGGEAVSVEGNECKRGERYAADEVKNPVRTFTSTVRVRGGALPLCPVRSDGSIPLPMMMAAAREVSAATAEAPIEIGQVMIENILETGVNIIASRSMPSAERRF
jgi:CxxC motif-containing protein